MHDEASTLTITPTDVVPGGGKIEQKFIRNMKIHDKYTSYQPVKIKDTYIRYNYHYFVV
jgi:hypothetical protein